MVDGGHDGRHHTLDIAQHIVVPEPDDPVALGIQGAGALGIGCDSPGVLPAVDLDDQLARRYGEIRDVTPNRMLSPRLDRRVHLTQCAPQLPLRFR